MIDPTTRALADSLKAMLSAAGICEREKEDAESGGVFFTLRFPNDDAWRIAIVPLEIGDESDWIK